MAGQQRLNIDDLFDVYGELYGVRPKWQKLGGILRVGAANLEAINAQYREIDDRLRETLSHWLRQVDPLPTWEAIVKALNNPVMNEPTLAGTIQAKHCPGGGGASGGGVVGGGGGAPVTGTAAPAPAPAKTKDGYKKLSKRRDDIIEYLAAQQVTNKLAGKLLATEVIAKAVYDKAKVPSLVETEKVTVIFDAVLAGVKLKPAKYTQFLDILNGIEGLGDIVEFIDGPLD